MKVSVLIPSNRKGFIDEAIESLMQQTILPHEILYLYNKELHPADKLNKLASIATGDALLILCDDDKLNPTYIEKTSVAMEKAGVDIVYTDIQKIGDSTEVMKASDWDEEHFRASTVPFITSLFKKSIFYRVGGFHSYGYYYDYDFWYRCFKLGASAYHLQEPLFLYRIHIGMISNWINAEQESIKFKNQHNI